MTPQSWTGSTVGFSVGGKYSGTTNINESFGGIVAIASASCNSIGHSYMEKTWLILMLTASSELKAFYLVDSDSQTFANVISDTTKQPYMIRGKQRTVEAGFDPVKNGNKLEVRNGQQFTILDIDLGFDVKELFRVMTVVIKLKVIALPAAGQTEPLLTLHSKKTFVLTISDTGALVLKNGASNEFTTGLTLNTGSYHYLQVSLGRFDYPSYDSAWSVALDTKGSEVGGAMTCKELELNSIWFFCLILNYSISVSYFNRGIT